MYGVINTTKGTYRTCDAIETITIKEGVYVPTDKNVADGFKALNIVQDSPSEQHYIEEVLTFAGHTLKGTEDYGMFVVVPEPIES